MIKIGNIVTYNKSKISLPQFNIYENLSEVDNDLPVLLLSYEETKKNHGELDFVDRKINENVFWTTTRVEDRHIYYKDLEYFITHCETETTKSFKYFFINPFELQPDILKNLIRKFKINSGIYYRDKDMIYLLIDDFTYGYHLEIGEIFGIPKSRVNKFLIQNNHERIQEDDIEKIQKALEVLEYDSSQLLFLKEKFHLI